MSNRKRKHGIKNAGNTAYIEGMRELRRSNAAGTHADRRAKRLRTRSARDNNAINDSMFN